MHTYMHTCMHAYTHTYIHTRICTHTQTHTHTHTHAEDLWISDPGRVKTNDLHNLYLSLHSLALSITVVGQGLVGTISG